MVNQRLMAIWKYDDDIGYLCGEIEEFLDGGYVKVKGYHSMEFQPVKVIPYKEEIKVVLQELKEELINEKRKLVVDYRKKFKDFVGGI